MKPSEAMMIPVIKDVKNPVAANSEAFSLSFAPRAREI